MDGDDEQQQSAASAAEHRPPPPPQQQQQIRVVRCPKCDKLLPELPNYSVYVCGGCGATLQGTALPAVSHPPPAIARLSLLHFFSCESASFPTNR
jgi:DNA-directed RNA polymerase subunit RPC12/RpoP